MVPTRDALSLWTRARPVMSDLNYIATTKAANVI